VLTHHLEPVCIINRSQIGYIRPLWLSLDPWTTDASERGVNGRSALQPGMIGLV
jgi:hypothetical protein